MTDRDRLIELLRQGEQNTPCEKDEYRSCAVTNCDACVCEGIADHLLANGVIVPPYEVGTKVCVIASQTSDNKNLYIFEDIITHYHIGGGCMVMGFDNHLGVHSWNWDKIFLTKAEAEQKLKELKK